MPANDEHVAIRSPEIAAAGLADIPMSYPAAAVAADRRRVFVEHGLTLRGEFDACDYLAIAGHVESDIALGILDILECGSFKGIATVEKAHIAGHYEGLLTVAETLVVGPTAYISGAVQCGKLQLEDGGTIKGELRVLTEETPRAPRAEASAPLELSSLGAAPSAQTGADEHSFITPNEAPASVDAMLASATEIKDGASLAEAEASFRTALEANLRDITALSGLGHLARQRGDLVGALRYFEQIMAADSENVPARCVSIDILRALSRHDEAAAIAEEVRALRLRQPSALGSEALDARAASPAFDEAEAMFKSVLDRHPKNLGALTGLGHLARRRGDRAAMHKYYMAALMLEPTNLALRVEVARAFKEEGDVALARRILDTVLNEQSGSGAAGRDEDGIACYSP